MMMEPKKIKQLPVLTTQGPAGELIRESQFVFNYTAQNPECEIALTMPLRSQSYAASILPGVLRQNLPEGYLLEWIKAHFGKVVTKLDDMAIMGISGRNTIGRVYCIEAGVPQARSTHESLKTLLTWKGTEGLFAELSERFAALSGVSGVQPKVLVSSINDDVIEKVSMKEREFIIKSSGDDYPGLAENEFICMSIAAKAALDVPKCWLSDDRRLFVIERFDIEGDRYLGFEDMTALMNKQNAEKYNGSYEQIAKAVNLFVTPALRQSSLESLFSTVALSVLLRNGDAHLKNFGLLYTHPQSNDVRLAPIYDIVTTTVYLPRDVLALKLDKSKGWPSKKQLLEFGRVHCNLDHPDQIVERIADAAMVYRPDEDSEIWRQMKPVIDMACFEYAA
jgi:serine/threonine-protein kinase HipA